MNLFKQKPFVEGLPGKDNCVVYVPTYQHTCTTRVRGDDFVNLLTAAMLNLSLVFNRIFRAYHSAYNVVFKLFI